MKTKRPEPGDKIIDSRDVIKAIDELSTEREDLELELREKRADLEEYIESRLGRAQDEADMFELSEAISDAEQALRLWEDDYGVELELLEALAEEAGGSGDWQYGETLILDSEFESYAETLAEDIGAVPNPDWPLNCIDWKQAAAELQQDYTNVTFGDYDYWIRS